MQDLLPALPENPKQHSLHCPTQLPPTLQPAAVGFPVDIDGLFVGLRVILSLTYRPKQGSDVQGSHVLWSAISTLVQPFESNPLQLGSASQSRAIRGMFLHSERYHHFQGREMITQSKVRTIALLSKITSYSSHLT